MKAQTRTSIGIGLGGEAFDVFPVMLLGVAVDEFAQGGVGIDVTGVGAEVAALELAMLAKAGKDELVGGLIDLRTEAAADVAEAGMMGRGFVEFKAEESAQGKRVGAAAGDGAQVLEEADHEHLEVDRRIDAGASAASGGGIGGFADLTHASGGSDARERLVELAVEGAG